MSAPALAPPISAHALGAQRFGAARTLDAMISSVWTQLAAHDAVVCPLCQGEMEPEYGARALPIAGRCQDCGTVLS